MFKFLKNKKGFTLIEVLVVVVIIGILAALAAPRIIGRINDARQSHDVALARTLTNAVEQYILDSEASASPTGLPSVWGDLKPYLDNATINFINKADDASLDNVTGKIGVIEKRDVTVSGRATIVFEYVGPGGEED